jgi:hypothetical protein
MAIDLVAALQLHPADEYLGCSGVEVLSRQAGAGWPPRLTGGTKQLYFMPKLTCQV